LGPIDRNVEATRERPAKATEPPWQFSLTTMLWVVTFGCGTLAAALYLGWFAAGCSVFVAGIVLSRINRGWEFMMVVGCTAALLALVLDHPNSRRLPREHQCTNRLAQVALALTQYESEHGSLPPAYVVDENGRPMYSWRVLILPYLDETRRYELFDQSQPWDAPANDRLRVADAPPSFRCPAAIAAPGETNYVAVVGPETCWPGPVGRRSEEIRDSRSQTILLVEVVGSGIHWMEPCDLTVDEVIAAWKSKSGGGISSLHVRGAHVCFADRRVLPLPANVDASTLRALLTVDGDEELEFAHD